MFSKYCTYDGIQTDIDTYFLKSFLLLKELYFLSRCVSKFAKRVTVAHFSKKIQYRLSKIAVFDLIPNLFISMQNWARSDKFKITGINFSLVIEMNFFAEFIHF